MAVSLAPWQDRPRLRLAFALLKAADQQTDPTIRKRMLLSAWQVAEAACEQVPRCASHHANRGRILLELARAGHVKPDAVFAAFDRALELDPCDSVACTDAARAATTLEQLDRAERYIDQGQRIDPNLGWLDAERAALALARRNLAEAETLLRQALEKDWHGNEDRLDRARLLQILILLQVGKATEANWVVETVLIRRPDWVQARWLHALVFERLGRRDEAIELFRYVLRLQPDNPHAHAGLVRLQATPNPTRTNEPRTK
jgi:tetratricopeptide (TPR) repeat protein